MGFRSARLEIAALLLLIVAEPIGAAEGPVVMITVSGLSGAALERRLADGRLPSSGGFATLLRHGLRATRLVPVDGAESPISGASLYTGTYPERHGIIGYDFRVLGNDIDEPTTFREAEMEAESPFEAAARQGIRGYRLLTYPGRAERSDAEELAVLLGTESWGEDVRLELDRLPAGEGETLNLQDGEGPVTLEVERERPLPLRLRRDGGGFRLEAGEGGEGLSWLLARGRWTRLALPPTRGGLPVAAFAHLSQPRDATRPATLLVERPRHFNGRPARYVADLAAAVDPYFWGPDADFLDQGAESEELWWRGLQSYNRQRREIVLWTLRNRQVDLLAVRMSLDPEAHELYAVGPRHRRADPAAASRRLVLFERSIRRLDDDLAELFATAPSGATFVVLSDHGMMTSHSTVRIHQALADAGFRVPPDPEAEVRVLSSLGPAHLYLNLKGREPGGVVEEHQAAALLDRLQSTLTGLRDPESGEPIFERVADEDEMRSRRLWHPRHSGDLWLVSSPGYTVDEAPADGQTWLRRETEYLGMHGFLSSHPENQGFFVVLGPRIEPGVIGPVRVIDVAPTVAALAGFDPPRDAQGVDVLAQRRPD